MTIYAPDNCRLSAGMILIYPMGFSDRKRQTADTNYGYVENNEPELEKEAFESIHNYISDDNMIRKGAISAHAGEKCIIPLNMSDGSLICIGKGNEDWNSSAPHGAGRIMSRAQAFKNITMDEYRESMVGIYSESITKETKD